jgi:hypothetical protein
MPAAPVMSNDRRLGRAAGIGLRLGASHSGRCGNWPFVQFFIEIVDEASRLSYFGEIPGLAWH